ncbi:polynucleotide kinase-phosphatase [Lewinella sp. LCG006]|uniref:polynucleotide kinase-phosphatase n=1 Tax=Lewinella sp. LCG006 TaxID=3231911 RepID=UPI00345F3C96
MNTPINIQFPQKCLALLIGASSAGKSTFAKTHFLPAAVLSSDQCRTMVANHEDVLDANEATFAVLFLIVRKRLERGLFTIVDATNLDAESRKALVQIAHEYHLHSYAIVLQPDLKILKTRNQQRPDRQLPDRVIVHQHRRAQQAIRQLRREGFRQHWVLKNDAEANITYRPMPSDYTNCTGPFDIIGDVHGCFEELLGLLNKLGYQIQETTTGVFDISTPPGRKIIFVGDLVDRGPASHKVLKLAMQMVAQEQAFCVAGNHDDKLRRYLEGRQVKVAHGLEMTIEQLSSTGPAFQQEVLHFLQQLPLHLELDGGKLLVAHAGLEESMHGRVGSEVRSFCLYGKTTGKTDEHGLPERYPWAQDYQGRAKIVYGHTPVSQPQWFNQTLCLDTGCVFGGTLSALRYPENEMVEVAALQTYAISSRPFQSPPASSSTTLKAADILGRKTVETRLCPKILIPERQALQALETMSRFAVDPRQLIYLPPTMSPVKTSKLPDFLEHPKEAFDYYREQGIERVVCQEKHMGSRAVITVGKTATALTERFGVEKGLGWIITRTGRKFFNDTATEQALLARISAQLTRSGFWERHQTDWVLLDAELMPWSAKASQLLKTQYAATATAGDIALALAQVTVNDALQRLPALGPLQERIAQRQENIQKFRHAYRQYCWDAVGPEGLRIAPFHLLATEGSVHTDKDHAWHLKELDRFCNQEEPCLVATNRRWVDLSNEKEVETATEWWLDLTSKGGEGMVVKPASFVAKQDNTLIQPALKVRGREYLRIIYGPDYTLPHNSERLRQRHLKKKRSLAEREFALGMEALERFVARQALNNVHQCVFSILALESEEVDVSL